MRCGWRSNSSFRAPGIAAEAGVAGVLKEFLLAFIEPFGTLWFIYLLPIFFVVTKLSRRRAAGPDLHRRRLARKR